MDVQIKAPCSQDPPTCCKQQVAYPWLLDSPGHNKELVNLLIHKWIVGFPHLGLQFGLIAAILLTYGKQASLRAAKAVGNTPE